MKKALLKDSVKQIKNTYKRFISIMLMAFLGVGFFAGIRATSPDMVDTIDQYYDAQNVYDIQIISTLGLTKEDIEELSKIENVDEVVGSYETDGKIAIENSEIITKVISLGTLNQPILLEGSLPKSEDECLVEPNFLTTYHKQIGDKILLEIENTTNDDAEEIEYLKQKEVTIVGTVQSPLYISRDRGTSTLGAGKINYYIYVTEENINAKDVYTSIYIKVKNADTYITSSDKYEEYIEEVKSNIEPIKEIREEARRNTLVEKAQTKVEEAEEELEKQKKEAQDKITEAQKELNAGNTKIKNAEAEIASNEQKADSEFANAKKEVSQAKTTLKEAQEELEVKEAQANESFTSLEKQKEELQTNLNQLETAIAELNTQYDAVLKILEKEELSEEQRKMYEAQKIVLETQRDELEKNKQEIVLGITQIDNRNSYGKSRDSKCKKRTRSCRSRNS